MSLKETFKILLPNLAVYDYADHDDFNSLWNLTHTTGRLLILWSKTSPDDKTSPINTTPAVSPIELAVCLANQAGKSPEFWPEITILNLCPAGNQTVPLLRLFSAIQPERLPWLKVTYAANLNATMGASPTELETTLFPPNGLSTATDNRKMLVKESLAQLKRQIRLNISEGGSKAEFDRHELSNLVAPMILRGGKLPFPMVDSIHLPALKCVLECVELIPRTPRPLFRDARNQQSPLRSAAEGGSIQFDNAKENPAQSDNTNGEPSINLAGVQLVLLDDQANHGWSEWLQETLDAAVEVQTSPDTLLDKLKLELEPGGKSEEKKWPSDLRFRFHPSKNPALGKQPILLLDLRLFAGNWNGEKAFLKTLLEIIENHFLDIKNSESSAFSSLDKAFCAAQAAVKVGAITHGSPEHIETLTWLSRVLAATDISLPVVLFSSTTRRDIVSRLAIHPNILTAFAKPCLISPAHFDGTKKNYGQPDLSEPQRILRDTLRSATAILAARSKCRSITIPSSRSLAVHETEPETDASAMTLQMWPSDSSIETTTAEQHAGKPDSDKTHFHVELYVDETGSIDDKKMSVGGCFSVFRADDTNKAKHQAEIFDGLLVKNGIRYFDSLGVDAVGVAIKAKNEGCATELKQALADARAQQMDVSLGFVRISATDDLNAPSGELHNWSSWDNRYSSCLHTLIEVFLFGSLPEITKDALPQGRVTVSLFIATRSVKMSITKADVLMYKYGLDQIAILDRGQNILLRSVSRDDIHGLVRDIETLHGISRSYDRILARGLVYEKPLRGDISKPAEVYRNRRTSRIAGIKSLGIRFNGRNAAYADELQDRNFQATNELLEIDRNILTNGEWLPDYRGFHYVADQILPQDSVNGYSDSFMSAKQGQFDECISGILQDWVKASRLLDQGLLAEAVAAAPSDEVAAASETGAVRKSAGHLLRSRLRPQMDRLTAEEFSHIVMSCSRQLAKVEAEQRLQQIQHDAEKAPVFKNSIYDSSWIVINQIPGKKRWRDAIKRGLELAGVSCTRIELGGDKAYVLSDDVETSLNRLSSCNDYRRNASRYSGG